MTGTLSLGSTSIIPHQFPTHLPKGPPPEPPPRIYTKGHGRSASLDLNAKPPNFNLPGINSGFNGNIFTSSFVPNNIGLPEHRCNTLPTNVMPPTVLSYDQVDSSKSAVNKIESRKTSEDTRKFSIEFNH